MLKRDTTAAKHSCEPCVAPCSMIMCRRLKDFWLCATERCRELWARRGGRGAGSLIVAETRKSRVKQQQRDIGGGGGGGAVPGYRLLDRGDEGDGNL